MWLSGVKNGVWYYNSEWMRFSENGNASGITANDDLGLIEHPQTFNKLLARNRASVSL
jgi:hypothetical protein